MTEFKIELPLSITIPRKKKADKVFQLNLNVYRNAHFMILNDAKVRYKEIVGYRIAAMGYKCGDFPQPPWEFIYTVFPATKRVFDVANVCAVIDKFTCDALQELSIIPDDNYKYIGRLAYCIGPQDKNNPRAELCIVTLLRGNLKNNMRDCL